MVSWDAADIEPAAAISSAFIIGLTGPIPIVHTGFWFPIDGQRRDEVRLGRKFAYPAGARGWRRGIYLCARLIARPKLKKFPCLFLRRPRYAQIPLRARIQEAARHSLER